MWSDCFGSFRRGKLKGLVFLHRLCITLILFRKISPYLQFFSFFSKKCLQTLIHYFKVGKRIARIQPEYFNYWLLNQFAKLNSLIYIHIFHCIRKFMNFLSSGLFQHPLEFSNFVLKEVKQSPTGERNSLQFCFVFLKIQKVQVLEKGCLQVILNNSPICQI